MNILKTLGAGLVVSLLWLVMMAVSCVMAAIPLAIGLTLIALFGRAIGAF